MAALFLLAVCLDVCPSVGHVISTATSFASRQEALFPDAAMLVGARDQPSRQKRLVRSESLDTTTASGGGEKVGNGVAGEGTSLLQHTARSLADAGRRESHRRRRTPTPDPTPGPTPPPTPFPPTPPPSAHPTSVPTVEPTSVPTPWPTPAPTAVPTVQATPAPTTAAPTDAPTPAPTEAPTKSTTTPAPTFFNVWGWMKGGTTTTVAPGEEDANSTTTTDVPGGANATTAANTTPEPTPAPTSWMNPFKAPALPMPFR
eukprot:TRINITY_DN13979_c0_g1_i1.p1 TRINITY_DN13979_c0_g1~~TRINITY_DN13979_c0_g1_i1.p1  ORF type:complete len:259 (-),score=20.71 TRINITY_DN13979_c0_g1_i1:384-1160(-)